MNPGDFASCGTQFWNGGPATDWQGVGMDPYGEWVPGASDPALNTSGLDSLYAQLLGDVEPAAHFVIDTSRNGVGPWQYPEGAYPAHEDWCNPPDRGLGAVPTTSTGVELADAYLWIKTPGESDGQCYRGTEGPEEPARGMEDPQAGHWFVEQVCELIELSEPALAPQECHVTWKANGNGKGNAFSAKVTVEAPASPWTLEFAWPEDQQLKSVAKGRGSQQGVDVPVNSERSTVQVKARGEAIEPWLFEVDGKPCTS